MTNVDAGQIKHLLHNTKICLSLPDNPSPNEWIAAKTEINLLVRLYSKIYLHGKSELINELKLIAYKIRPDLTLCVASPIDHFDFLLSIGNEGGQDIRANHVICFDSDGWLVRLTRGQSHFNRGYFYNPLAASAAACFAANELFKTLFSPYLNVTLANQFTLSLLDYSVNSDIKDNENLLDANIGEVWLAGAGAVGNGFLYGLSLLNGLKGTINIVDNREITTSNLQRYILLDDSDIEKSKATTAAKSFSENPNVNVKPIEKTIQDCFEEEVEDRKIDTLICAVDTIETRKQLQTLLPRLILNGWTRMDEFAVTRHEFDSKYRCLSCLYDKVPKKEKNEMDNIAEQTGFSKDEVLTLIRGNVGLSVEHIERIAKYRDDTLENLTSWIGRPLQSFYHEAICGGISIATNTGEETVPLAHISALAGILLANELIKEKNYNAAIKHKVQFHMTNVPNKYLLQPELKSLDSNCICTDDDFLSFYKYKWGKIETLFT